MQINLDLFNIQIPLLKGRVFDAFHSLSLQSDKLSNCTDFRKQE